MEPNRNPRNKYIHDQMISDKTIKWGKGQSFQPISSVQSWVFFGRNDAKAETPVLWPPHVKSWLIGKDSDAGRDWGQEEKGTTEDEMAGWHHWLDGREFEWTPEDGDGQGGLACCDAWGHKESDTLSRVQAKSFMSLISALVVITFTAPVCLSKTAGLLFGNSSR